MEYDLNQSLTTTAMVVPVALAATANSVTFDAQLYQGTLKVILNAGICTAGTTPSLGVQLQTSDVDTAANYAAIDTSPNYTAVTGNAASLQATGVDTRAIKRYLRAVLTVSGTNTPSWPVAMTVTGFKKITA